MNTKALKHFCVSGPDYGLNVAADQYRDEGMRLLRTTDVGVDGRLAIGGSAVHIDPAAVPAGAVLRSGDLLLSRSGTLGRTFLVPDLMEPATYAGYLVRFRPAPETEPRYLWYCAQSQFMQDAIASDAIQSTIGNFNGERYANVALPDWSTDEQRAIANYLDREIAHVDAFIRERLRALGLVKERFAAIRDHAFASSRGFRLKRLLRSRMAYGVLVPEFVVDGPRVPMIRTYNLTSRGTVDRTDVAEIPSSLAAQYQRTRLDEGDVILSVVGGMGRAAVAGSDDRGSNLNRPLARLRPRVGLPPRLLWHWTQTTHFLDAARLATGGGTAQPTLNLGDLENFVVGLPDDDDTWPSWLSSLERERSRLDRLEDLTLQEVDLLRERRRAVITAAVTGRATVSMAA